MKQRPDVRQANVAFQRARALHSRGDRVGAEKIYRAVLKQHPNHFDALFNLAEALMHAGRFEEAVPVLRKALNQEPNSANAHAMLASAFRNLERYEEALERAKRAIALDPRCAPAHSVLAGTLAELGRYDEAIEPQARAIELAPDNPFHYYQWGYITRWTAGDPRLAALEGLLPKAGGMTVEDQVHLHYALAKAYGDCGDIDRSFRHLLKGAALNRSALKYEEAGMLRQMQELCGAMDAEWIRRHQGAGDPSPLPLFICGMPRSGTTLVEQILASHPKVRALGERRTFEQSLAQICGTADIPLALGRLATQWSASELRGLGALYVAAVTREAGAGAVRITDKAVGNFRFSGLICAALPNARLIHMRRDPVDTCLSMFSIHFAGSLLPYSYDLGEVGRAYRAYEKTMAHWRNVLPPGYMLEVQYEEVVDDLDRQARRIIAHCGLEWDDACLEFYKSDRPVRTASHAQVRRPIYHSSVGRPRPSHDLLLPLYEALGIK